MIARSPVFEPAAELQRDAELLIKYWILAIPTAVASLAFAIIVFISVIGVVAGAIAGSAAAGHTGTALGLTSGILVAFVAFCLGIIALYVASAMVIAEAPAVLEDRPPDLAAGLAKTLQRLPDLMVAMLATFALAFIPFILCFVLIGIPLLLVLGYFLMYVPAAVIIGNEGGIAAIRTSFRIATQQVSASLIGWLGLFLVMVAGSVANSILIHIPLVNFVAAFAIGGFTSAYSALVTVSFYLRLRDLPPPQASAPAPYMNLGATAPPSPPPGEPPLAPGGPPTIIR